jgi:DhnA family fructose-bisphosphate aldolase class Ia
MVGSAEEVQQIVDSSPIPVISAGGAQVSDGEFNRFVAKVMESGARGIAAGRNIFMAADPAAKVREVRKVLNAHFVGAIARSTIPEPARVKPGRAAARVAALS